MEAAGCTRPTKESTIFSLDRGFDDQRKIRSLTLERFRASVDGHWLGRETNLSAGYGCLSAERDPSDQVQTNKPADQRSLRRHRFG